MMQGRRKWQNTDEKYGLFSPLGTSFLVDDVILMPMKNLQEDKVELSN
jgi:hypothetical protein